MPTKVKATFNIRRDVFEALSEAVVRGAAPSKNAFVELALQHELKQLRRRAMAAEWKEAARDPKLLRDLQEVSAAFEWADAETARATE